MVAVEGSRDVDHAVVGFFHLARSWAGVHQAVAPLTVVAVGRYGESLLLPGTSPEILLLVPEGGCQENEARRMARLLIEALRDVGLAPVHRVSTAKACLAVARDDPRMLEHLSTTRHLAGAFATWARLWTGVDGGNQFFCGGGGSGKVRAIRRPRRGSAIPVDSTSK